MLTTGITGLLLAGGRSSRMGVDKASLVFEGEPLARRVARVLEAVCDEVLVASGDGRRLDWVGPPQVADVAPDAGPLAGLVAGLERASHPVVAVLAVDMPFASAAILRLLASRLTEDDAVVPVTERGPEPLHAVYAAAAAPALRAELEAARNALIPAVGHLRTRFVEPDEWREADPSGRFARNVNQPEDLA